MCVCVWGGVHTCVYVEKRETMVIITTKENEMTFDFLVSHCVSANIYHRRRRRGNEREKKGAKDLCHNIYTPTYLYPRHSGTY